MWVFLLLFLDVFFVSDVSGSAISPFNLPPQQLKISALNTVTVQNKITTEDLYSLNDIVSDLIYRMPLEFGENGRLIAYLYNAQKAFADASNTLTGSYSGNLGPITLHVLQLFYPNCRNKALERDPLDSFSKDLTALLTKKIDERFNQEQLQIHPISAQERADLWHGKEPYTGIKIPTMTPWVLQRVDEFRAPKPQAPEDSFWEKQLALVKNSMQQATESQKKQILYWAGMSSPKAGDFILIAEKYMSDQKTPLSKQLEVRSVLASVLFDTMVALYDSKYAHMVRRPFMLDKTLRTYIPTPNHPSYPAGHSAASAAAATVLSYYFPENKKEWERQAEECGFSRIWAGLHFPIDNTAGKALGDKVAKVAILRGF